MVFNAKFTEQGGEFRTEIASSAASGGTAVKYGDGLKMQNGVLSVDTAKTVEQDNTKPVTSGAVYTEIGNIELLLAAL